MQTINDRFRFILKETGLSQKDFADRIKRSRGEIANIVYDKVTPKDKIIEAVCDEFDVDLVWLETGVGEPFREKSKEDELASVFGSILAGHPSQKNAFISAIAQLPDELFPVFVKAWIEAAEEMKKSLEQ